MNKTSAISLLIQYLLLFVFVYYLINAKASLGKDIWNAFGKLLREIWRLVIKILHLSFQAIIKIVTLTFTMLAKILSTLFDGLAYLFPSGGRTRKNLHGNASFMNMFEKYRLINRWNQGICVDGKHKLSVKKSYNHVMIVGGSGTGKTSRLIIPSILSIQGSMVITDPSGEMYAKTQKYLRQKGFQVKKLDFINHQESNITNPLLRATTHAEIEELADVLVESSYAGEGKQKGDAFWSDSAKSIISIVIKALHRQNKLPKTLHSTKQVLDLLSGDRDQANLLMADSLDDNTFAEYRSFLGQSDNVLNSVLSTAKTALRNMSNPTLAHITSGENLNFEDLRKQPTAIFIMIPEDQLAFYSFFTNLLYNQLFRFAMKMPSKEDQSIFFLLDEFAQAKFPNFATVVTTLRKRRASLTIVLQNQEQLQAYGSAGAAATIADNCASKIYFPGLNLQTAEKVSKALGNATVSYQESGFSEKGGSRKRQMGQPLMSPDDIIRMKKDRALFVYANEKPIKLKTIPYFKRRYFKRLLKQ